MKGSVAVLGGYGVLPEGRQLLSINFIWFFLFFFFSFFFKQSTFICVRTRGLLCLVSGLLGMEDLVESNFFCCKEAEVEGGHEPCWQT